MTDPAADLVVITPPGLPILDAAAWVGHACWAELRLHAVLTHWLTIEVEPAATTAFWTERSDAADRAEAWHRRLPELREYPRSSFVQPSSAAVAQRFDELVALDQLDQTEQRRSALAAVLISLRIGYEAHQKHAVGPADAPTATTLTAVLRSGFGEGVLAPAPTWVAAIAEAGGLP